MVLLIIIPFLNCYFIGNIPYFQTNPDGKTTKKSTSRHENVANFICFGAHLYVVPKRQNATLGPVRSQKSWKWFIAIVTHYVYIYIYHTYIYIYIYISYIYIYISYVYIYISYVYIYTICIYIYHMYIYIYHMYIYIYIIYIYIYHMIYIYIHHIYIICACVCHLCVCVFLYSHTLVYNPLAKCNISAGFGRAFSNKK